MGLVAYSRKEGRALGEVTKFLVYNARKRQAGGDTARPMLCPHRMRGRRAGHALPGADARHPAHWLGVRKIHRLVSMSNMKYDAITGSHRGGRAHQHPR